MRLLTAKELADRWQVSDKLIFKMAAKGEIPSVKLGRCIRFNPAHIEAYENNTWKEG